MRSRVHFEKYMAAGSWWAERACHNLSTAPGRITVATLFQGEKELEPRIGEMTLGEPRATTFPGRSVVVILFQEETEEACQK